eukprot:3846141-Rhodomonas_salina.1
MQNPNMHACAGSSFSTPTSPSTPSTSSSRQPCRSFPGSLLSLPLSSSLFLPPLSLLSQHHLPPLSPPSTSPPPPPPSHHRFSVSRSIIVCPSHTSAPSRQFGLEPLVERCEAFILRNAAQTFIHPTMEVVPEEEVCRLLDEDALQILEVEAFVAVLRWGRARYGDKVGRPCQCVKSNAERDRDRVLSEIKHR